MKSSVKRIMFSLLLLFICMACTNNQEVLVPDANQVEVQIEIPVSGLTKNGGAANFSILVFKEQTNNQSEFFRREKGNWVQEQDNLEKTLLLPSGKYRFLLTYGFPCLNGNYNDFLLGAPLRDCFFSLPASGGAASESAGELFLDDNTGGKTPWNEVYDCTVNAPQVIQRTLTRSVGRVDVLVRRGKKFSDGTITPVDEGTDMDVAYKNTLKKIKEIGITVRDVGSKYYLDGAYTDAPVFYSYVIVKNTDSPFFFTPFDADGFEKQTSSSEGKYDWFDKYPYCEGPFLFPSVGKNKSTLEVRMYYTNFPDEVYTSSIEIERNKVSLVTLWLLEEKLNLDVNLSIVSESLREKELIGDDGIWN